MDNSAYITLSRQTTLFRDLEVTANNLANVNTTGYQSSHMTFNAYLTKAGKNDKMAFANDISTYRRTENGAMQITGNPLDVALQGEGYFVVQTPLGLRYTRAGNFQLDAGGSLITPEGYAVLDDGNQPITLPEDARELRIGENGSIIINGAEFGTIGVKRFENELLLENVGSRLLKTDAPPLPAENTRMAQGMLESSNVVAVAEMTHMIDLSRSITSTTKMMEALYDMHRRTQDAWVKQS